MIRDRVLAWIGGGASLALAAALAFVWITKGAEVRALKDANGKLAHRLELHAADLAQCRSNGRNLEAALTLQGRAIDALAAAGRLRLDKLEGAMSNAMDGTAKAQRTADRILAATATGDLCEAADRLMREEAGE